MSGRVGDRPTPITSPEARRLVEELVNNTLPEPFLYPQDEYYKIGMATLESIEEIVTKELEYRGVAVDPVLLTEETR